MGSWSGTVPSFTAGQRVRASKLQTLADIATALTAAWTTYAPTNSGITVGNGSVVAAYRRLSPGHFEVRWKFTMGSTSAIAGPVLFDLPSGLTLNTAQAATVDPIGTVVLTDTGTNTRVGPLLVSDNNTLQLWSLSTTGIVTNISSTVPHTWANTDVLAARSYALELA